jgi:hypothetical protein
MHAASIASNHAENKSVCGLKCCPDSILPCGKQIGVRFEVLPHMVHMNFVMNLIVLTQFAIKVSYT